MSFGADAVIELEARLSGDINKKLAELDSRVNENIKSAKRFKGSYDEVAGAIKIVAGSYVIGKLIGGTRELLELYDRQAKSQAKVSSVIKSTGREAGLMADEVFRMSSALQEVTLYGDEVTNEAAAMLLSFKGIGNEVLPEATKAMADMATIMQTDLKSGAIQLGKALGDPVQGIAALTRVGVTFSEEQKNMIQTLQESGRLMDAQKIILSELKSEFGGAAEAAAKAGTGGITQFKNAMGDLMERLGEEVAPILGLVAKDLKSIAESMLSTGSAADSSSGMIGEYKKEIAELDEQIKASEKRRSSIFTSREEIDAETAALKERRETLKGALGVQLELEKANERARKEAEKKRMADVSASAAKNAKAKGSSSSEKTAEDASGFEEYVDRILAAEKRLGESNRENMEAMKERAREAEEQDRLSRELKLENMNLDMQLEEDATERRRMARAIELEELRIWEEQKLEAGADADKVAEVARKRRLLSEKKLSDERQKLDDADLKSKLEAASQTVDIFKELFKENKSFATAAAIVQAGLAMANAAATQPFIPAGLLAWGKAAVMTKQAISGISGAKYESGGILGGNSTAGDQVLFRGNAKEVIMNNSQQKRLLDIADGNVSGGGSGGISIGGTVINVSGNVSSSDLPMIRRTIDEANDGLANQIKRLLIMDVAPASWVSRRYC